MHFFEFDRYNQYIIDQFGIKIKNIDMLNGLIFNDNWSNYDDQIGAPQIKSAIKKLKLRTAFRIARVTDSETIGRLEKLKSNEIMLLSIPPLPKTIFDGLYTWACPHFKVEIFD